MAITHILDHNIDRGYKLFTYWNPHHRSVSSSSKASWKNAHRKRRRRSKRLIVALARRNVNNLFTCCICRLPRHCGQEVFHQWKSRATSVDVTKEHDFVIITFVPRRFVKSWRRSDFSEWGLPVYVWCRQACHWIFIELNLWRTWVACLRPQKDCLVWFLRLVRLPWLIGSLALVQKLKFHDVW